MTESELVNLVLEASGKTEMELPRFRILGLATEGLELTGKRARAARGFEALQKAFSVTITAGVTDLTALPWLLFDPLKSIVYPPGAGAAPAVYLPTVEDLQWGGMTIGASEPVYYAEKGQVLVFRNNADGALTTLAGTGSVVTNYIPSLTDATRPLPDQFRGLLAATIAELATGQPVAPELAAGRI